MNNPYTPVSNWKQRRRHGMNMSRRMLLLLQQMRQAKQDDWPWVILEGVHKRTINSLLKFGWVAASVGLDGTRYSITVAGLKALSIFEQPPRRFDGICPACGIRPKQTKPNGRIYGYCVECEREHKRKQYHLGRYRMNPDALCCQCHERPRHRTANGKVSAYCTQCRHARRAQERQRMHELNLERIRRGEVLLCRRCKERPRRYTDKYVHDYCRECQREYMNEYNHRRRHGVQP